MNDYVVYKKKEFKLQKDAMAWAREEKKKYGGSKPIRIETNYNPGKPLPWEGIVMMKDGV